MRSAARSNPSPPMSVPAMTSARRRPSGVLFSQRGHLTRMKRVNGAGMPVSFAGDEVDGEPQDGGVAEIRIPFPADRPAELDYYNEAA